MFWDFFTDFLPKKSHRVKLMILRAWWLLLLPLHKFMSYCERRISHSSDWSEGSDRRGACCAFTWIMPGLAPWCVLRHEMPGKICRYVMEEQSDTTHSWWRREILESGCIWRICWNRVIGSGIWLLLCWEENACMLRHNLLNSFTILLLWKES